MPLTILIVIIIMLSYLVGSIPFGLIVGRLFKGIDVREYGSGKTGATNVMRTAGVIPGVLALLGDFGKGAAVVFLARAILPGNGPIASGAALACTLGHNWPVFARFRGGRGVTTFFGGLMALSWIGAAIGVVVTLSMIALTRYVSLGSLTGSLTSAAAMAYLASQGGLPLAYFVYAAIGAVMLLILHRDNIGRLVAGRERKFGQRVELDKPPRQKSEGSHA